MIPEGFWVCWQFLPKDPKMLGQSCQVTTSSWDPSKTSSAALSPPLRDLSAKSVYGNVASVDLRVCSGVAKQNQTLHFITTFGCWLVMIWSINHSNMRAPHRSMSFGSTLETHSRFRSVRMISRVQRSVFQSIAVLSIGRFHQILTCWKKEGSGNAHKGPMWRAISTHQEPCCGQDNVA